MVVFPVPPEVEPAVGETDLGVLEAERELTQYFQLSVLSLFLFRVYDFCTFFICLEGLGFRV